LSHYLQAVCRRAGGTRFAVSSGEDELENIHLLTTVDLADPDEVVDLVIERLAELQVDEGILV